MRPQLLSILYRIAGATLLVVPSLAAAVMSRFAFDADGPNEWVIPAGLLGLVAIYLWRVGLELLLKGRRLWASAIITKPKPPFVLYLRAFIDDPVAAALLGMPSSARTLGRFALFYIFRIPITEEEHLIRALESYAPVVAIGQPGEELPQLGAKRIYFSGADWQEQVSQLMRDAELVVLRMGDGSGLTWELEEAMRSVPLTKLVVMIPGRDSFSPPDAITIDGHRAYAPYDSFTAKMREIVKGDTVQLVEHLKPSNRLGTLRNLLVFDPEGKPTAWPIDNSTIRWRLARYPLASVLRDMFGIVLNVPNTRFNHRARLVGRRLLASVIDYLLLTSVFMFFSVWMLLSHPPTIDLSSPPPPQLSFSFERLVWSALPSLLYFVMFETRTRHASIGKRLCGLRVVGAAGGEPDTPRIVGRTILKLLFVAVLPTLPWPESLAEVAPYICWGIALVGISIMPRPSLHDWLAGTRVVVDAHEPEAVKGARQAARTQEEQSVAMPA